MATNGQTDVLARSVTHDDYNSTPQAGNVFHFMLPSIGATPELPGFWSYARDWALYSTIYRESMWAAAIYIAVTKIASKSWEVESDITQRQKRAQDLFLGFDNRRGWVSGISKHLQAYLLTGQGGIIEIVRATSAAGARVLGLIPLDPFRVVRTGDADIPFLYWDRRGGMHELRDYDAFAITDQPDFQDLWYGVGHCAAERAYYAIQKLETIERYIYEKVSGKRALALDFVSGVLPDQVSKAQAMAREESAAKGVYTYMGSTIIPLMGDTPPTHVRVNLAELPNGFERKEEFDLSVLTYARSIGIPVQDLQPLSGQGLGTGAQSNVLEESAKGQGLATWPKAFGHAVNEFALDDKTTFYIRENDIRDREREAKVKIDEATAIKTWVDMQAITIEQARQLGVDRDQLPQEFIPDDMTPGGTLSDSEKPVTAGEVTPEDTELPADAPQAEAQTAVVPALESNVLKSAREIYHALTTGDSSAVSPNNTVAYERLLEQQSNLIETLVSAKSTRDSMSDSVRKAIDIAWQRMAEPTVVDAQLSAIKGQLDNLAQSDDVTQLGETLKELNAGTLARHDANMRVLRGVLDEIRDAHTSQQGELVSLRNSVMTLASKDVRVTVKNDEKAMRRLAQDVADLSQANLVASLKHAEDLTVRNEIVETDRNGLASMVERTLASGQKDRFRIVRNGSGRIQRLDKI